MKIDMDNFSMVKTCKKKKKKKEMKWKEKNAIKTIVNRKVWAYS